MGLVYGSPTPQGALKFMHEKNVIIWVSKKKYIQQYILQSGYTPDISTVCTISVSVHNTQSPGQAAEFNDT